ncbi:microfibril associated protein 5 [Scleropages formosus]|uniref:Microfibril associated protein 5 n=2 Tax=Scleropages formosus TaxID=113540 RepID=A0A8C9U1D6_SCLFO|nr:microfibrillar-associated protein 2-like [Scleropages formosus]
MGGFPVVLLLCSFQVLIAVVWAQQAVQEITFFENDATPEPPQECREETYPCTRMYSVHQPIKRCIHSLCLYSIPRVYVINKEICVRTVCQQEEFLRAELCRERSGWPKRLQRSTKKRCRRRNSRTWENKN